jgi:hypothetical protein
MAIHIKRELYIVVEYSGEDIFKEEDVGDVLVWYQERLDSLAEDYKIKEINISYESGSIFKIIYEHTSDDVPEILDEMIADPDDDGNYPIREGVLVVGSIAQV